MVPGVHAIHLLAGQRCSGRCRYEAKFQAALQLSLRRVAEPVANWWRLA